MEDIQAITFAWRDDWSTHRVYRVRPGVLLYRIVAYLFFSLTVAIVLAQFIVFPIQVGGVFIGLALRWFGKRGVMPRTQQVADVSLYFSTRSWRLNKLDFCGILS